MDEVLPFLIDNSLELGIQALHDYVGDRIWRPPGCSDRPTAPSPECGWRTQGGSGGQMGQTWATWIHVEVTPDRWIDTRTVEQMLGEGDEDMPLTDEDIARIAEAVWNHPVDTTKKDADVDPEPAGYWLQRAFLIVRQYLGSYSGRPPPDPSMLKQIDGNTK